MRLHASCCFWGFVVYFFFPLSKLAHQNKQLQLWYLDFYNGIGMRIFYIAKTKKVSVLKYCSLGSTLAVLLLEPSPSSRYSVPHTILVLKPHFSLLVFLIFVV